MSVKRNRWIWFCIWLTGHHVFGSSNLINELREIIDQTYSDRLISYEQYQDFINKLQEAPVCPEIKSFFAPFEQVEWREVWKEYCLSEKKPDVSGKASRWNSRLKRKIVPLQAEGERTTLEAEYQQTAVTSRWLVKKHETPVSLRQAAWRGENWKAEAGNLSRRGFLDFVLGRNLPRGRSTRAVARGLLAGERTHLNGIQFSLDSEHHRGSLLGSWQPLSQSPPDDLKLAAGKYRLSSPSLRVRTQGYLEQQGSQVSHAVWGTSLSEKLLDRLTAGAAASWRRTENKMGWFGNMEWKDRKERMHLVLYQSSSHWFNPRMHPGYRRLDTLDNGTVIPGRGEGGWRSRIRFSLVQDVDMGMTSRAHWSLGNDFHFLTYRGNLGFPLFRSRAELGVSTVREHSRTQHSRAQHNRTHHDRTYHNTGGRLKWSWRLADLGLKYSQKWGDYSGGLPRPLAVSFSSHAIRHSRHKIRWRSRDAGNIFERHDLLWFQQWNLFRGWNVQTSLKLPFERTKVTDFFYASWQLGFRY